MNDFGLDAFEALVFEEVIRMEYATVYIPVDCAKEAYETAKTLVKKGYLQETLCGVYEPADTPHAEAMIEHSLALELV